MAREARIQAVMAETGMDEMQAYRHVQAKDYLNTQMRRDPAFLRKHIAAVRAEAGCSPEWMPGEDRRGPNRPWSNQG